MSSSETTGPVLFHAGDVTPPSIVSRQTADLDGDGLIDAVHVSFSEPVSDAAVTAASFDVEGATLTGEAFSSTTRGTADDADIYITFTGNASYTTASLPSLTVTAGGVRDLSANSIAPREPSPPPTELPRRSSSARRTTLTPTGSSTRCTSTSASRSPTPRFTAAGFNVQRRDPDGRGLQLDHRGDAADDSDVYITFTENASYTTASLPTLTVTMERSGTLLQSDPRQWTRRFHRWSSPALWGLVTRDTNGNGYVDRLELTFSENVQESTIVPELRRVLRQHRRGGGRRVSGNALILVDLADGVLYTDALPALTIAPAGIEDVSGNPNSPVVATSPPMAPPCHHRRLLLPGSTTISVRFSEPVDTSNVGSGDLVVGTSPTETSRPEAPRLWPSMGTDADASVDATATLVSDAAIVVGDLGADTVAPAAGQIYDPANNAASVTARIIGQQ